MRNWFKALCAIGKAMLNKHNAIQKNCQDMYAIDNAMTVVGYEMSLFRDNAVPLFGNALQNKVVQCLQFDQTLQYNGMPAVGNALQNNCKEMPAVDQTMQYNVMPAVGNALQNNSKEMPVDDNTVQYIVMPAVCNLLQNYIKALSTLCTVMTAVGNAKTAVGIHCRIIAIQYLPLESIAE